tara:strand:- start:49 stop:261 length:213 start_codon:yes stop_codon:yes gene_type:complete
MSDFFANWMTGIPMMIAIVVLITLTVIELRKKRAKQREFKLFLEFKEAWGCNYEEFKMLQKIILEEHNKQ